MEQAKGIILRLKDENKALLDRESQVRIVVHSINESLVRVSHSYFVVRHILN